MCINMLVIRLRVARESHCDTSRRSCNTIGLLTNNMRLPDKLCEPHSIYRKIYNNNIILYRRHSRLGTGSFLVGINIFILSATY